MKEWVMALVGVSFLAAAAQSLMPDGAVKKVGELACGLLLFLVVTGPILGARYDRLLDRVEDLQDQAQMIQQQTHEQGQSLIRSFIERESRAYSQDKRDELDLDCQIEVLWDWSAEPPVPEGVVVTGQLSPEQRQQLSQTLQKDLDLTLEQIQWREGAQRE